MARMRVVEAEQRRSHRGRSALSRTRKRHRGYCDLSPWAISCIIEDEVEHDSKGIKESSNSVVDAPLTLEESLSRLL
ncbi:hypothetical protein BHE74_00057729 [Ensete ventricosum]|nr:hypothetical protein BHE74_00057729 [Ensete ventricosum]